MMFRSIILLLCVPLTCFSADKLISIHDDKTGHLWRTRELFLLSDGRIIEETYDWSRAGTEKVDSTLLIRVVSDEVGNGIYHEVKSRLNAIPNEIDAERPIALDTKSKTIRIKDGDKFRIIQWNDYSEHPVSPDAKAFDLAWLRIEELLLNSKNGSP